MRQLQQGEFMLQQIADWLSFTLLRLERGSGMGGAVDFFIYDSLKILLLLFGMIWAIGVLRTFLPAKKTRRL